MKLCSFYNHAEDRRAPNKCHKSFEFICNEHSM